MFLSFLAAQIVADGYMLRHFAADKQRSADSRLNSRRAPAASYNSRRFATQQPAIYGRSRHFTAGKKRAGQNSPLQYPAFK